MPYFSLADPSPRRRPLRAVLRAAVAAVAFGLAACEGVAVMAGPRSGTQSGIAGRAGGGSATAASAALVGQWTRFVQLTDGKGQTHLSQTTWTFERDGNARRAVTAWNVTYGYYDTVVATARWRVDGTGMLVITYVSPNMGTVSFSWQIQGTTLHIGSDVFDRIPT